MTIINIASSELIAAIKRVLPHTSTDDTLPVLTCIKFAVKHGYLYLSATDRYTLVESRVRLEESAELETLVYGKQLKALLPSIKLNDRVILRVDDEGLLTVNDTAVSGQPLESFPRINSLWPDRFAALAPHNLGLSVANIKKLSALPQLRGEKNDPLVFGQHPDAGSNKPVIVLFGNDTRVLIMPVRVGSYSTGDFTSDSRYEDMACPASVAESAAA